jgi:hypothetical protein
MMRVLAIVSAVAWAAGCGEVIKPQTQQDAPACTDTDHDGVCDPLDRCAGFDDKADSDADGTADGCDKCAGFDDAVDSDTDGVADGCDKCAAGNDAVDADLDLVADACDACPGYDDRVDANANQVPDACEPVTAMFQNKIVGTNYWRGWHSVGTAHTSTNDNTITGAYSGGANSYFVFTLSGLNARSIVSVTLELELEYYVADATETLSVWDVSTPAATVDADAAANSAIYTDLMTGNTYGTKTFSMTDLNTVLSIPLNAQANTDVKNASGTDFTVGIHLDSGATGAVRFSASTEARHHVLVVKYLPTIP